MKMLTALLLFLPILAIADPEPWLKKENPSQIYLSALSGVDCPVTSGDLQEFVEDILNRAGIKPLSDLDVPPALFVTLDCQVFELKEPTYLSIFIADFIGATPLPNGTYYPVRLGGDPAIAVLGRGNEKSIKTNIQETMEALVADYVRVNVESEGDDNR